MDQWVEFLSYEESLTELGFLAWKIESFGKIFQGPHLKGAF